jgi:hypothetical protein
MNGLMDRYQSSSNDPVVDNHSQTFYQKSNEISDLILHFTQMHLYNQFYGPRLNNILSIYKDYVTQVDPISTNLSIFLCIAFLIF